MRRFGTILKWLLMIYGSLTLLLTLTVMGFFVLDFGRASDTSESAASKPSAPSYLQSAPGLSGLQDVREDHHYIGPRESDGYQVEMRAFHASGLEGVNLGCLAETCSSTEGVDSGWRTGDRLPPVAKALLGLLDRWSTADRAPWLPRSDDIASRGWYVYSPGTYLDDFAPSSLTLIVLHPVDDRAYWINLQR